MTAAQARELLRIQMTSVPHDKLVEKTLDIIDEVDRLRAANFRRHVTILVLCGLFALRILGDLLRHL